MKPENPICKCDFAVRAIEYQKSPWGRPPISHAADCPVRAHNQRARDEARTLKNIERAEAARRAARRAAGIERKQSRCPHPRIDMISHEEGRCRICGTYISMPDID